MPLPRFVQQRARNCLYKACERLLRGHLGLDGIWWVG